MVKVLPYSYLFFLLGTTLHWLFLCVQRQTCVKLFYHDSYSKFKQKTLWNLLSKVKSGASCLPSFSKKCKFSNKYQLFMPKIKIDFVRDFIFNLWFYVRFSWSYEYAWWSFFIFFDGNLTIYLCGFFYKKVKSSNYDFITVLFSTLFVSVRFLH